MKTVKKTFSFFLAVAMVLFMTHAAFAAGDTGGYSDMPDTTIWSGKALRQAVEIGLLEGKDGKISPKGKLTNLEMASVFVRLLNASSVKGSNDLDKAKAIGIIESTDQLDPNGLATRETVFAVLARIIKPDPAYEAQKQFSDDSQIAEIYKSEIYALVNAGYINGYPDKTLKPKGTISREEIAVFLFNTFKTVINKAGTYDKVDPGNVLINAADVTVNGATVKGDLVVADGVGSGKVTLNNTTLEGRAVIRGGGENSVAVKGTSKTGKVVMAAPDGLNRVTVDSSAKTGGVVSVLVVDAAYTGKDGDHNNYKTIQAAIEAADEGDTVLVKAGTYKENVAVNKKGLTLKSAAGPEKTQIVGNSVVLAANQVTLNGFTLDNQDGDRCIAPGPYNYIVVKNNILNNSLRGIQGDYSGSNTNMFVIGNRINADYGLSCTEPFQDITVKDNTFNCKGEAIGIGVGLTLKGVKGDIIEYLKASNTFLKTSKGIVDYRPAPEPSAKEEKPAIYNESTKKGYDTIADAVKAAKENQVIAVSAGTYDIGTLGIAVKGLTLKGTDGASKTIVKGEIFLSADKVTLQGLTINGLDGERCIFIDGTSDSIVTECVLTNCLRGFQGGYDRTSNNLTITKSTIEADYGIACTENLKNVVIKDNVFKSKDEAIGVGAGFSAAGATDIIKYLTQNNKFEGKGKIVDYR